MAWPHIKHSLLSPRGLLDLVYHARGTFHCAVCRVGFDSLKSTQQYFSWKILRCVCFMIDFSCFLMYKLGENSGNVNTTDLENTYNA